MFSTFNIASSRQKVHDILQTSDIKTYDGKHFLQLNNAEKEILYFSLEENKKCLSESTKLYVDDTFSSCTKCFTSFSQSAK